VWKPGLKGFLNNEQCFLHVKTEYLKKTVRARVQSKLFGVYDGWRRTWAWGGGVYR
jgi:hypothetical protein